MKFLPYDLYKMQTSFTIEEIVALLQSEVEPRKRLRFSCEGCKTFEGEISWEGFRILRIINYRNSFLPVIRGKFRQEYPGVTVEIQMRPHVFVIIFMCVWFLGVILGMAAAVMGVISRQIELSLFLLIPFGMFLFGLLMVYGGFWTEARKSKALLEDVLRRRS
ncbi:MAG: hypothetical protein A4E65_01803 [Syntrophorhabdus sp. PtaU1.Bin153]|nr:MAG: hypothetical protein A4E65_01803 [Syntrophorhabdus sp. PtaU1.Bin153]